MSEGYSAITWWRAGPEMPGTTLGALIDEHVWVCVEGANERDPEGPMPVFMALGTNNASKLVCRAMVIGDLPPWRAAIREVTAVRLRAIRIPELIALAVRSGELPDEFGLAIREHLAAAPEITAGRPGPRGYSDEHFRDVADLYRRALIEAPSAPTKWLAEYLVTSLPTARRWVQRARDRGYLGASIPGKPGEQSEQDQEPRRRDPRTPTRET